MMKRFESDYLEGAHPDVLRALIETNGEQTPGYGEDPHCEAARALLRERCALPEGEVQFLVGGTQVNRTVIASILRPHQGVVAADTGHIAAHETGAIENSGHKVLTVPNTDGKIAAAQVEELCRAHYADASFEHTVQPGMVYISNPTEFGTVYTRGELEALHAVCKARHLPLFIDGARLGAALYSPVCDYTLADMAHMCEVFTIGGTKMGLLFGEAAVFSAPELAKDFRYFIKQNGGMLAKGRPRLDLPGGVPLQPAVPHSAGRAHRTAQAGVFVQPYAVFPKRHERRALLHELGDDRRRHRRAA